ncbi:DoxX family protein [Pseudacidovorax sp. 1753]|uniref:DoxX family protein n=1 Tax=Pseudacidovorax sp. 1753 TaxID=3156419 RepID=UPI0033997879
MDFHSLSDPVRQLAIICGLIFIPHSIAKFTATKTVEGVFQAAGLHPVRLFVALSLLIEVISAVGLIFNLLLPYAAWLGATFMLCAGAASFKVSGGKWNWSLGGCEFHVFWAFCLIIVALHPVL